MRARVDARAGRACERAHVRVSERAGVQASNERMRERTERTCKRTCKNANARASIRTCLWWKVPTHDSWATQKRPRQKNYETIRTTRMNLDNHQNHIIQTFIYHHIMVNEFRWNYLDKTMLPMTLTLTHDSWLLSKAELPHTSEIWQLRIWGSRNQKDQNSARLSLHDFQRQGQVQIIWVLRPWPFKYPITNAHAKESIQALLAWAGSKLYTQGSLCLVSVLHWTWIPAFSQSWSRVSGTEFTCASN